MNANNPKDVAAPESNLSNEDRPQPDVSNPTTGADAVDEDGFPAWDGGGYRGRPKVPIAGVIKTTSTNSPNTVQDGKKSIKPTK